MPRALAAMRGVKAEGGWGVVCTEEVEIHHTSDLAPNIEGRLWDDKHIPALKLMVDEVHKHGALAGIELTYAGHHSPNFYSRAAGFGPRSKGVTAYHPVQTRRADKEDIRNIRCWHRAAALRARQAGFDIIYVYASHNLSLAMHFLLRRYNDRSDEYGGSLQNRTRFLRELIEDTKDAVGDTCAVAVRFAIDELLGDEGITSQGEGRDILAMLAELPDLWDVNISNWSNDSTTARFQQEGYQQAYVGFVKSLTSKPVVAVGRYTSPESMLSVVRKGIADMVGAARPSIADPFLPQKIQENRFEDIRECIGCNICASADELGVPIRCTQNPTMGEEWRRNWHPERIMLLKNPKKVLVVGAGPAGLECGRALGQRGCQVVIVEAKREPGGRVSLESKLTGLNEWRRVVDWRMIQTEKMENVTIYPNSPMRSDKVLEAGFRDVIVATGAHWRTDGVGRNLGYPIPGCSLPHVFSPDDLMNGRLPSGNVAVYDDDHYYMGSVLAEFLAQMGCRVTLITPAPLVAYWARYTLEQEKVQRKLMRMGVELITQHLVTKIFPDSIIISNVISSEISHQPAGAVVLVSDRIPNDGLYNSLKPALEDGRLDSLCVIGDAEAPNIIAQAVFSGHLAAREFGEDQLDRAPFCIEYVEV